MGAFLGQVPLRQKKLGQGGNCCVRNLPDGTQQLVCDDPPWVSAPGNYPGYPTCSGSPPAAQAPAAPAPVAPPTYPNQAPPPYYQQPQAPAPAPVATPPTYPTQAPPPNYPSAPTSAPLVQPTQPVPKPVGVPTQYNPPPASFQAPQAPQAPQMAPQPQRVPQPTGAFPGAPFQGMKAAPQPFAYRPGVDCPIIRNYDINAPISPLSPQAQAQAQARAQGAGGGMPVVNAGTGQGQGQGQGQGTGTPQNCPVCPVCQTCSPCPSCPACGQGQQDQNIPDLNPQPAPYSPVVSQQAQTQTLQNQTQAVQNQVQTLQNQTQAVQNQVQTGQNGPSTYMGPQTGPVPVVNGGGSVPYQETGMTPQGGTPFIPSGPLSLYNWGQQLANML